MKIKNYLRMYKGELTNGRKFFDLLFTSDEFNVEMGKVMLAAGQLEAELMLYLIRKDVKVKFEQLTLGQLIGLGKKNDVFNGNLINALELLRDQRNYLTHNIYALLTNNIEETILEARNLLDADIHTYTERAWQLKRNLIGITEIIRNE